MLLLGHKPINTKTKKLKNKKATTTMDSTQGTIEPVTISEVLELANWDRPRSGEELRDFISRRASLIGL